MNKAIFAVFLFLILFSASALGASITSLTVTSPVKVGEDAAIRIEISEERQPIVKIFEIKVGEPGELVAEYNPVAAQSHEISYTTTKEGNFRVTAEISQPCEECAEEKIFSVIPAAKWTVPEINLVVVVLIAFGVLGILALKTKKIR